MRPPRGRGRCCSSRRTAQRWLEAVGPELLDGSIADDLAGIPSEAVRVPFAIQGLIGTLAGPSDPGHRLRRPLPRPRRGVRGARGVGLRARRHGRGDGGAALGRRGGGRAGARRGAGRARVDRGGAGARRRARGRARGAGARRAVECGSAAHVGARGPSGAGQLAPGRSRGQGHAAARRPARLSQLAGAGAVGRDDRHRLHARRPRIALPPTHARAAPAARPWIEAACQTAADPTLAPPGRHVLSLFCQCFPTDADADAAADAAIARFAEVCPQLPDRIVDRLVARPARARSALRHHRRPHLPRRDARRPAAGAPLPARGASAGWRASTWRAPAPIPAARSPGRRATSRRRRCWRTARR